MAKFGIALGRQCFVETLPAKAGFAGNFGHALSARRQPGGYTPDSPWWNYGRLLQSDVCVAINIKNREVERLVSEVAELTGESKTEAVRKALAERKERLQLQVAAENRGARLRRFLEEELWPSVPADELGRTLTRTEEEAILGYGDEGV